MNVWLVSPAWRRFDVTRLALAQRRWLCDELAERGHEARSVIVADDDNLDIAAEYGFDTVEMGNADVGEKFNAGYVYAADRGADIFVHVGSDDWVHPDAFAILDRVDLAAPPKVDWDSGEAQVWRRSPQVVAQRKATVANLLTGEVQRCSVPGSHGCIPWLIPRPVLEPGGFRPVPAGHQRGIDGALARGLTVRPHWLYQDAGDDWLVDFKSAVNITSYRALVDNIATGPTVGLEALAVSYPADLVALAVETCGRLRLEVAA